MEQPELKHCPFCGGKPSIRFKDRPDPPSRYWVFYVACAECGAKTKDFPTGNFYGMNYTPDDAANAWNERAPDETTICGAYAATIVRMRKEGKL